MLVVDWLGRGGIAQTSESWVDALEEAGAEVRLLTRAGREVERGPGHVLSPDLRVALLSHAALVRRGSREIRTWRPDVVVAQNYIVPAMEAPIYRAARRAGAATVFVIHNAEPHERRSGASIGLAGLVRRASALVAHSDAVAGAVRARFGRDPILVPHPVYAGMRSEVTTESVIPRPVGMLQALQVGVLDRRYKGTDRTVELARLGLARWQVGLAGSGAPVVDGVTSVDRYLTKAEMIATVRSADVVLLPYHRASQSGVVVLAQMLGTVVVATAVDGLAEQVEDGVTGVLLSPGAPVAAWAEALRSLEDPERRRALTHAASSRLQDQHDTFRDAIEAVVGIGR